MVLPLIPVAMGTGALAMAVMGLKKASDAKQNFSNAELLVKAAEKEWCQAAKALEVRRQEVSSQLNLLAMQRMQITGKSLSRFARLMDQVAASDFDTIKIDGNGVLIEVVPIQEIKKATYEATEFLQHGLQSVASGAMVGAGVEQAVSIFGAASTGVAIFGLSGTAATNATLAWLEGGSLASGGLGVAGGTAVLGGVVAGPVLLVMGYLAAGKSEELLTQARTHSTQFDGAVEQLENASLALDALDQRARKLAWMLDALDERFQGVADRVARMVGRVRREREARYLDSHEPVPASLATRKIEYAKLSEKDQKSFHAMTALGSALYQVVKVEILDKEGRVTEKSKKTIEDMQQFLGTV